MMKKIYFIPFLVSIFLSFSLGVKTISAEDNLEGSTAISAQVVAGNTSFSIENEILFDSQTLSNQIDIGLKEIEYVVTDYSGTVNGYEITAKLLDIDPTRTLKVADVELSDASSFIVSSNSNIVGENTGILDVSLEYKGISEAKTYTTIIEWTYSSSHTSEISE